MLKRPETSFDLSPKALAQRWRAGSLDMQHAVAVEPTTDGIQVVRRFSRA
jgi:NTE family protein